MSGEAEQDGRGKRSPKGDERPAKPAVFERPLFRNLLIAVVAALVLGGTLNWLEARR